MIQPETFAASAMSKVFFAGDEWEGFCAYSLQHLATCHRIYRGIINPQRTCAAKVMVLGLCVRVCVSVST